ncbi:primase-helicase family protein [Nonlabens sp. Asnod2-A12]|uniref:primase-helicase family protein n=1 Tax=Nonlabens sp. Asnod2-A12 TaxID=3160578 RepID=UPI00386731C5
MSDIPYLRIGTSYYRIVQIPTLNNELNEALLEWSINTIKLDHNSKYLHDIPKYLGKVCFPDHFNFQKDIHGFYNTYSPFKWKPEKGSCDSTIGFFKHIFGDQVEFGLDYFKLLYEKPTQNLPILCLVSRERSTGKTSFLKYLKEVFGYNMTYLDSHSMSGNFNLDWGNKLILACDEAFFDKAETVEKIKHLSTSNKNKIEAKGKEKYEVDFFGHFVLTSNRVDSFMKIDQEETRLWVRKLPVLKTEDVHFLKKVIEEIPAFLNFIIERKFASENKTRSWFTPEQIFTPALQALKNNSRDKVGNEIAHFLFTVMESLDVNELQFIVGDLADGLSKFRNNITLAEIRKTIQKEWSLEGKDNSYNYSKFYYDKEKHLKLKKAKGRYFTITKSFLIEKFDDLMT